MRWWERLRVFWKLNKGALDLYVGNGNGAVVEAIWSFDLILPSAMILVLDNCHFSHSITRGVISLSCLWDNDAISVSKDNVFYFIAIPRDVIFEIDMHNHVSNERSIYTCSNKKSKHNLDYTFLWHYRLSHINKKRIAKLQHDGLLKSIDDESFVVCVSCISGKMARKPFTHASERVMIYLKSYKVMYVDHFGPRLEKGFALESTARILNMVPTKKVNKTPYKIWHEKVPNLSYLKNSLMSQEASGSIVDFDEIQRQYVQPSKNTSQHQHEVEHDDVDLQIDLNPFRRSARIPQAPERYGFYIYAEEHELGDHGGHLNYRVALSDPEFKKWLEAMNAEMQSIKDNQGFVNPKHPRRVCKLQRSIYRLKQAFRSWNKRFDEEIKNYGFTQSPNEPYVYKRAIGSIIVFLILFVDDILLMGNNIPMLQYVKSWLGKCFAMKELGEAAYILGIKIYRVRYTRPDVAFSQNLTSRYQQNPGESYWTAVKKILKYLRNTKDMFPVYGGGSTTELSVTCYTDASSETDRDDLRSHMGCVFVMNRGAVDWKCSKQSTTAMSSMEAEYIAAVEATIEAIWIRKFIYGLGFVSNNDRPIDMYRDNTGAITIADEPGVQKGAKHFLMKISLYSRSYSRR
nr:hypothetical protein [Tanacetum cinerariifolium]